ncbi:MAG: glycosyltransferase family 2 protein [Ginsengibacter sp.]
MIEGPSLISVDLISLNWNSARQTLDAVRPYLLFNNGRIKINVIVVDNASSDNSLEMLNPVVPKLIVASSNMGFARACNLAFAGSTADFILLVNPDTVSDIHTLKKLIDFMQSHPEVAITGPQQRTNAGKVLHSCGRIPTFKSFIYEMCGLSSLLPDIFKPGLIMRDWDHLASRYVDHVMGSYMLIRRNVIKTDYLFNNDFFLYLEDIDLSKRISDMGHKIYFNADVNIFHEGASTGNRSLYPRLYYFLSTRRKYWKKYMNRLEYFILILTSIFLEPFLRLIQFMFGKRKLTFLEFCKVHYNYFREIVTAGGKH